MILNCILYIIVTLQCLKKVRDEVCHALGISIDSLELSMGMSEDFEHAVSYTFF
jgi:uncharacterized pyridoxal phosphate-containing UPF0001 family protein